MKKFKSVVALMLIASMLVGCSNGTNGKISDKKTVEDIFSQSGETTEISVNTTSAKEEVNNDTVAVVSSENKTDNEIKGIVEKESTAELIWDFQKFMETDFAKPYSDIYENVGEWFKGEQKWILLDLFPTWEDELEAMSKPMEILTVREHGWDDTYDTTCLIYATVHPNKYLFPDRDYSETSSIRTKDDLDFKILSTSGDTTDNVSIGFHFSTTEPDLVTPSELQKFIELYGLQEEFAEDKWIKSNIVFGENHCRKYYFTKLPITGISGRDEYLVVALTTFILEDSKLMNVWNESFIEDIMAKVLETVTFEVRVEERQ